MRRKLFRIRSPWRRLLITISVNCLLFFGSHARPRARMHWLGRHHRPRRLERVLFFLSVFGAMLLLEPREFLLWSALWGGTLAIFLNLHTIYVLILRKRYHWVKQ